MMTYRAAIVLCLLIALPCLSGCAAWATYPPIPGALQIGRPEVEPVPTIMAEAIRYSNERYLQSDDPAFNLPEGMPAHVYDSVKLRLRGGRPLIDADEPAVHIQQVRVRSGEAQVDVAIPRSDGFFQLVTLHMRQRFAHRYAVQSTRLWRIHVEAPQPRYPALLESQQAEQAIATAAEEAAH